MIDHGCLLREGLRTSQKLKEPKQNTEQNALSIQLIKPSYVEILPPTQHHSFLRNLPSLFLNYVTPLLAFTHGKTIKFNYYFSESKLLLILLLSCRSYRSCPVHIPRKVPDYNHYVIRDFTSTTDGAIIQCVLIK